MKRSVGLLSGFVVALVALAGCSGGSGGIDLGCGHLVSIENRYSTIVDQVKNDTASDTKISDELASLIDDIQSSLDLAHPTDATYRHLRAALADFKRARATVTTEGTGAAATYANQGNDEISALDHICTS